MINKIMDELNNIQYGFLDVNNLNLIEDEEIWEKDFSTFYHLQSPVELRQSKVGVCWDQVELERELFSKTSYIFTTYFIYIKEGDMLPSHTFLVYEDQGKYYWFEHSWNEYRGIHEYTDLDNLLLDVVNKFYKSHPEVSVDSKYYLYKYDRPKYGISCDEFYKYIENSELVDLTNLNS